MSSPDYPFTIQEPDWAFLESRNPLELAEASVRRTARNRAKRAPLLAGAGLIEPVSAEGRLAQWQTMLREQRKHWQAQVAQVMERYGLVVVVATPEHLETVVSGGKWIDGRSPEYHLEYWYRVLVALGEEAPMT